MQPGLKASHALIVSLVQVACDADNDPSLGFNPSCNNSFAIQVFSNFERALSVYRCELSVAHTHARLRTHATFM
jgi:hypothetical protein